MKALLVTVAILLCGFLEASSQTLRLTESFPAGGDSSIALQTTVRFSFDAPIDTTYRFSNDRSVAFFAIEPADSIAIDSMYFSEPLTDVFFDVRHTPETDFVWMLTGAVAQDSTTLCAPYSLNYTTSDRYGDFSVSGMIGTAVPVKRRSQCEHEFFWQAPLFAALLSADPLEDGRVVRSVLIPEPSFPAYDIHGVRPGTYWPAALVDANFDGEINIDWFFRPSIFAEGSFWDQDNPFGSTADGFPDSLVVEDSSFTSVDMFFVGPGSNEEEAGTPLIVHDVSVYPNPFIDTATISFRLDASIPVQIAVFDALGRRINTLLDSVLPAGKQEIEWKGIDANLQHVASGLYLARIQSGNETITRTIVFLR